MIFAVIGLFGRGALAVIAGNSPRLGPQPEAHARRCGDNIRRRGLTFSSHGRFTMECPRRAARGGSPAPAQRGAAPARTPDFRRLHVQQVRNGPGIIAIPGERGLHVIESLGQHAVDEVWRHGRLPGPVRFFERERQILLHLERSREGLREPFEGCKGSAPPRGPARRMSPTATSGTPAAGPECHLRSRPSPAPRFLPWRDGAGGF